MSFASHPALSAHVSFLRRLRQFSGLQHRHRHDTDPSVASGPQPSYDYPGGTASANDQHDAQGYDVFPRCARPVYFALRIRFFMPIARENSFLRCGPKHDAG